MDCNRLFAAKWRVAHSSLILVRMGLCKLIISASKTESRPYSPHNENRVVWATGDCGKGIARVEHVFECKLWHLCAHRIRPGKTTTCEKGLRENRKRTRPRLQARTTSPRAGSSASKMSTGFCSPGNARLWRR